LVGLIVGLVSGASGAAAWFLLTGDFDLLAMVLPVFLFVGFFLGHAFRTGMSTPLEQLSDVN
jgi:hypothetical protein